MKQAKKLGLNSRFLGGDTWDSANLARVAAGASAGAFFVNHFTTSNPEEHVIETQDVETAVDQLNRLNYVPCATVLDEAATALGDFSFPERTVLIFGNEAHGIAPSLTSRCKTKLTVPMLNSTDSLNVSIAAGIFCHTYRSQHRNAQNDGNRQQQHQYKTM